MSTPPDRPRRDSRTDQDAATPPTAAEDSGIAETVSAPAASASPVSAPAAPPKLDEGWRTLSVTPTPASSPAPLALPVVDPKRFHLEDEIGRGGVGRVVRAVDRPLGRPVAIKQMLADAPDLDARFYREMRLTAKLQHPGIVPLYDAGRWPNGQPFYAMKLVEGRSLKELLATRPTRPERLALLPKLLAVCDTMAYAHAQGVVHRDLKPANVLIGPFGETLVIDWGVAKDLRAGADEALISRPSLVADDGLTVAGSVVGTPAYMPPEQARGEDVDERADVYALGAMLYELLSGQRPYRDSSSVEVLKLVVAQPPRPVHEVAPDAPPELLAIVEAAMARDRQDRYRDAKAMAEDLRRFEAGQLVGAHRYPMRTLLRRWVTRHRAAVQATLLFVLGGAIAGGLSIRRVVKARDAAEHAQRETERALVAARDRQDQLILTQARTALDGDPTAALAWLKQLPVDTHHVDAARELATSAWLRGYAEHAWYGPSAVSSVSYSRDGRYVAAAFAGRILIADAKSGHTVEKATTDDVGDIAFAPEGSSLPADTLFAPGHAGALWLLGPDGTVRRTLEGHTGSVLGIAFSADGKTLLTGGADGSVRLWNVAAGTSLVVGKHAGAVDNIALAPDGNHAASASGPELALWDLRARTSTRTVAGRHYTGLGRTYEQPGEYRWVAFSPDGRTLATVLANDTHVELHPVGGGPPERLAFPEILSSLKFTPEGGLLIGAESGKIYRWLRGHPFHVLLEAANNEVADIALVPRPGSRFPLIIGGATRDRLIELVRPKEDDRFELHGHAAGVRVLAFSPDGERVLSGGADGSVRLWWLRPQYDQTVFTDGASHNAAISPDGSRVAYASDGAVELQKIVADTRDAEARTIKTAPGRVTAVAWSPAGTEVAAAQDGGVWLVGLDGSARRLATTRAVGLMLAFADGGRRLVGVDADGGATVWDVASGQSWPLPLGGPATGAASVGGTTIAIPVGARVLTFSAREPERAPRLLADGSAFVAAAVTPDGARVVTGSSTGGVTVWNSDGSGRRVLAPEGTGARILALGTDGAQAAALDSARDLRWIDLASGRVEAAPHVEASVRGAVLSPDLTRAVAWAGTELWVLDRPSFCWRSLPGFVSNIHSAALSPDGNLVTVMTDSESSERIRIGASPVPRDGAGLRRWLDDTTTTAIQANRPTTTR